MKKVTYLLSIGLVISAPATELKLWNKAMPGKGAAEPESVSSNRGAGSVLRITNVSEPMIRFFPAKDQGKPNPVVIVCPGGGYQLLAFDKEGTEIAAWLNSIGVSAAVLKYRVPDNRAGALLDAQRAVELVREHANALNTDPKCVGMLGFSAGGHLTAVCSNSKTRPDFSILIYPAYLFKEGGVGLVDEVKIDEKTPPAFVVQAQDDKQYYQSSLTYTAALDAQGIPVELHLFAKGGHGFGLRSSGHPVSQQWPVLCEGWMRASGFIQ